MNNKAYNIIAKVMRRRTKEKMELTSTWLSTKQERGKRLSSLECSCHI